MSITARAIHSTSSCDIRSMWSVLLVHFSHTVAICYFLVDFFVFVFSCFIPHLLFAFAFNTTLPLNRFCKYFPKEKHDRQHDSGNIQCIFYQDLHLHPSQQSLHIISICHRKTSKKQNIWLPDRKHSFPAVVANNTIFTENGGWYELNGWNNY